MRDIKYIVIHHSDSPMNIATYEKIKQWHLERGFKDIGYHATIDKNGILKNGRDIEEIGAHAKGINPISIGICIMGSFQNGFEKPKEIQIDTLIEWISDKCKKYNISPSNIIGHRDVIDINKNATITQCPGDRLYKLIPSIKDYVRYNLKSKNKLENQEIKNKNILDIILDIIKNILGGDKNARL